LSRKQFFRKVIATQNPRERVALPNIAADYLSIFKKSCQSCNRFLRRRDFQRHGVTTHTVQRNIHRNIPLQA
jgi:hypothetical protein